MIGSDNDESRSVMVIVVQVTMRSAVITVSRDNLLVGWWYDCGV